MDAHNLLARSASTSTGAGAFAVSADLNIDHRELYKDLRLFLLGLFPDAGSQIIQALQNNQPLPLNAIVMQILFSRNLDESVTTYTNPVDGVGGSASVQNSVDTRVQFSFYGPLAQRRSRTAYMLWKNYYGTENLTVCQPLYVNSYDRRPYINDSNQYEDRWILDVALQYNPQVTYAQDFAESAGVTITPVAGA